jgi:hypothetical protein
MKLSRFRLQITLILNLLLLLAARLGAEPIVDNWMTDNSGQYARSYTTYNQITNGNSVTTWTNQTLPAYADIQAVQRSTNWVYIQSSGLASYMMGPWYRPRASAGATPQASNFYPEADKRFSRFPRSPVVQNGTKDSTGAGISGLYLNGTAIFNSLDGKAYDGDDTTSSTQHFSATYHWHQLAPKGEGFNMDPGNAHQLPAGLYHAHQDPIALRYQLGDHVTYNSGSKTYSVSNGSPFAHSPLIGFAYDGYPVYGPYGYGTATDANSAVRRMVTGYALRDGTYYNVSNSAADTVTTGSTTLPAWYTTYRTNHGLGTGTVLARPTSTGSENASYNEPDNFYRGIFAQDYSYKGDLKTTAGGSAMVQGTDFDLDKYNGRFCVTPEYPAGTYAYFVTIDAAGKPVYPFVLAFEYYGDATGGTATAAQVNSENPAATTIHVGGQNTPLVLETPSVDQTSDYVSLTWSSVEGGTYLVESSADGVGFGTEHSNLASAGTSTSASYHADIGTGYAKVTRSALSADYEDTFTTTFTTAQTDTESYTVMPNVIYVSANRLNQDDQYGDSWATAYSCLQDALYDASPGTQIWVRTGIYYPHLAQANAVGSINPVAWENKFTIPAGVEVYGGFGGAETVVSQRNPTNNVTILSGDVDRATNPDSSLEGMVTNPETQIQGTNAWNLVTMKESGSVLDGFTLTACKYINDFSEARAPFIGNGIVRNCRFRGNWGYHSGGVSQSPGTLTIDNCDFFDNVAWYSSALSVIYSGAVVVTNSTFSANKSLNTDGWGTCLYLGASDVTLTNCAVFGNLVGSGSSVIRTEDEYYDNTVRLINCTVASNYNSGAGTTGAGGIRVLPGDSTLILTNTIVWDNGSANGTAGIAGNYTANYSLIQAANPGGTNLDGTGADNSIVFLSAGNAANAPTQEGDYRLLGHSPCVGAGNLASLPADVSDTDSDGDTAETIPLDVAGNARVLNTTLDLGAYEYNGPMPSNNGTNVNLTVSETGEVDLMDLYEVFGENDNATYYLIGVNPSGVISQTFTTGETVFAAQPLGNIGDVVTITFRVLDYSSNQYIYHFTITLVEDPDYLEENLASWYTARSSRYARLYASKAAQTAGTSLTTWSRGVTTQSLPVYAGPQRISYSDDYVYLEGPNLAPYVMGPWYLDAADTQDFANLPGNQKVIFQMPRVPVIPATPVATTGDSIGYFVDGSAFFNMSDTFSYDTSAGTDDSPVAAAAIVGDGVWNREAYFNEGVTLDPSGAHQAGSDFHHHAEPLALRYLKGDSMSWTQATNTYAESFNGKHSPILGWAQDGLPIYGPYGYSAPLDSSSAIRRMVSGYQHRTGTTRTTLPTWCNRLANRTLTLAAAYYGPNTTVAGYGIGHYIEDYDYKGDIGQTVYTGTGTFTEGTHYDLNEFNARFCVTPEFPNGTWAYFCTISSAGAPIFPFLVGPYYMGDPVGGELGAFPAGETRTTYFQGGGNKTESPTSATASSSTNNVTLVWDAVEGGTYQVKSTTDLAVTATNHSAPVATTDSLTVTDTGVVSGTPTKFYTIERTALAANDVSINVPPTFTAQFGTSPALPPQSVVTSIKVGTVTATISSYDTVTGAVGLTFSPTALASGSYPAVMTFTGPPPGNATMTRNSSNSYVK